MLGQASLGFGQCHLTTCNVQIPVGIALHLFGTGMPLQVDELGRELSCVSQTCCRPDTYWPLQWYRILSTFIPFPRVLNT